MNKPKVLFVIVACCWMLCGCDKIKKLTSSDISSVKNGTLEFDKSLTVGQAVDKYRYFKKTEWEELKEDNGRRVVQATGFFDISKHPTINTNNNPLLKLAYIRFQFILNQDNTFQLGWCGFGAEKTDGTTIEPEKSSISLQCINSLKEIYANESNDAQTKTSGNVTSGANEQRGATKNSSPIIREQIKASIEGHDEVWLLEWLSPTHTVCGPDDDNWTSCPCTGFAFGESGNLALVRKKPGQQDEQFSLSDLFDKSDNPGSPGEAVLRRWDVLKNDSDGTSTTGLAARVSSRPLAKIMTLGDYAHDGKPTQFVLQVGTEPCGKRISALVGVSHSNQKLHVFGTAEHPERPLFLEASHWESLRIANGPINVISNSCGDHGSETETDLELLANGSGLHATKKIYSCPEGTNQKRQLRETEIL